MQHPKLSSVSQDVWEILFHALRSGEKIHIGDYRIENKSPYITHPIKVVISWLHVHEGEEADPMNVLVLILHDVIEEHPESWKDILEEF